MKTKIIPSINVKSFSELKEKIDLLKKIVKFFHLDVAKKKFTGYQTWANPNDLDKIDLGVSFEVHLMTDLDLKTALKWNKKNVFRFILHPESSNNFDQVLPIFKKTNKEVFLAWSPKIKFDLIEKYLSIIDGILILSVVPGKSGQEFLKSSYQRLLKIKKYIRKDQRLIVDGGINEKNIKRIVNFHPNYIIMASALYKKPNPEKAYKYFSTLINNFLFTNK